MFLVPPAAVVTEVIIVLYAAISACFTVYATTKVELSAIPLLSPVLRARIAMRLSFIQLPLLHTRVFGAATHGSPLPQAPLDYYYPFSFGRYALGEPESSLRSREERVLLSKIFAGAPPFTQVIPYYYQRQEFFDEDDLTITTLVSVDRFPVLSRLVEAYQGGCTLPTVESIS